MEWTQINRKWEQMRGRVLTQWSKLTDDDLTRAGPNRARLAERISDRYGVTADDAGRQLDEWVAQM